MITPSPTSIIPKNNSREFNIILTIIGIVWVGATVVHSVAQYKLAKANKRLSEQQSKKLEKEGYA